MNTLALIVLTYNEEAQIKRSLLSAKDIVDEMFIVDSYSTDRTVEISESIGAFCLQNKWSNNHGKQFNWGLDNLPIKSNWVMRIDADEYLLPELQKEFKENFKKIPSNINAIILKRRVYFMNKWIKWGGYYPHYSIRAWRKDEGRYDERLMDEIVYVYNQRAITFKSDFVDDNMNSLSWWITKHNNYATREAVATLSLKYKLVAKQLQSKLDSTKDKRKRWVKDNIYFKFPLFIRPGLYFIYRYFFRLGFLDGKAGLIWHFLQGFWYRFLVDAKIYDLEQRAKKESKTIAEVIQEHYGIDIQE